MDRPEFVYVTYIASSPESVWNALIDVKITPKYWQKANVSDWKIGSRWEHRGPGEESPPLLAGRVVELIPPRRLVLAWASAKDEGREEAHSRVTFEIEPLGEVVRLVVTHDRLEPGSEMQTRIADGWPRVLSSLKSFLETGRALPEPILSLAATPMRPRAPAD